MASISDYENNLQQARIDAAAEPSLRKFIDSSDFEIVTVDLGDGHQAQVQALASSAVRKFIERILAKARQDGVNIKDWICSEDEFDLCSKLKTPVGELMRQLDAFLKKKLTQGGLVTATLFTLFTAPAAGVVLTIFGALGFINNTFVELCDCPARAESDEVGLLAPPPYTAEGESVEGGSS